ncbi:MAG: LysR family transcriptional regulator [Alphaproteobacteria bacterium]
MNLNQLRFFLSIAETGSVTRSAELLHLSQPALTRGIRQLEEELGVSLFQRLPRAMRLTRFGTSFLRHAQSVFVQLENAQAELQHLSERTEDEIVIGSGPTWTMGGLAEIVGSVLRTYPNLSIKVRTGYDQQLADMLRSGEVDFALTDISRDPDKDDLSQEPLIHCQYVVACRNDHPLAGEKNVSLERLLAFPWAMPDRALSAYDRLAGLFRAESLPVPVPLLQSTSFNFILRLLETSDALSFVVESSLQTPYQNPIVAVDMEVPLPIRHAGIVMRPDSWISPATEALIDQLRAHCKQNPIQ